MYTLLNSTSQLYFRFCLLVVGNRNLLAFRPFCAGYFVNCRYIVSFFSSKPNKIYYSSCFDLKWFRSRWSSIKPNQKLRGASFLNSLHPNISIHILHTVFYTFPKVLKGEFVYRSKASFVGDHFLYSHDLNVQCRGDIMGRN